MRPEWYPKITQSRDALHGFNLAKCDVGGWRVVARWRMGKQAANRVEAARLLRQFEESSKTKRRVSSAIHQCW